MAGALKRIGEYLGLVDDDARYDEYADEPDEGGATRVGRRSETAYASDRDDRAGGNAGYDDPRAEVSTLPRRDHGIRPVKEAAELSRITTLRPRTYNDARVVGEHFRDGTPVIMDLTSMDDADAKRLVDFAAGLIFGVRGAIERITTKVFLLSPENVEVTAEDKRRIVEQEFFNQS
jgi:cell division inhibitor SepF